MASSHLPLFIAVTGPVACGKSTIVKYFLDTWPDVVEVVQADNYYLDRSHVPVEERSEVVINYDVPDAIDFETLRNNLERLRRGECILDAPKYDFLTHTSSRTICLTPKKVVLVDGHQLLHGIPRQLFPWDLSIYVDTPLEVCFERRLLRECRSYLDIATQHILKTLPAHETFGAPQACHCDLVLPNAEVTKQAIFLFILSHSPLK